MAMQESAIPVKWRMLRVDLFRNVSYNKLENEKLTVSGMGISVLISRADLLRYYRTCRRTWDMVINIGLKGIFCP